MCGRRQRVEEIQGAHKKGVEMMHRGSLGSVGKEMKTEGADGLAENGGIKGMEVSLRSKCW